MLTVDGPFYRGPACNRVEAIGGMRHPAPRPSGVPQTVIEAGPVRPERRTDTRTHDTRESAAYCAPPIILADNGRATAAEKGKAPSGLLKHKPLGTNDLNGTWGGDRTHDLWIHNPAL